MAAPMGAWPESGRERLAAGGRSARAARGILARMTHAEPSSRANRIASAKFSPQGSCWTWPGRRPGFFLCEQLLTDQNPIGFEVVTWPAPYSKVGAPRV